MSRFPNRTINTRERYIRVGGTFKPIIDLETKVEIDAEAKIEIDLTKDEDDDEITFMGWKRSDSSNNNNNWRKEREQRRAEKNNVMNSSHRTNEAEMRSVGYNGQSIKTSGSHVVQRSNLNANASRIEITSADEGPYSTIRPEINRLGTKRQDYWSRVGGSNQGPSLLQRPKLESHNLQLRSKSNTPFHFEGGEEEREDIGSEDDYETTHSGLDIHDESRWVPPPENNARVENIGTNKDWITSSETDVKSGKPRIFRTSRTGKLLKPRNHGFVWDLMADLRQRPPSLRRHPPSGSIRGVDFGKIKSEKAMRVKASFKVAPGAINRIEQHDGWLVIGSSCIGGQADEPDEDYNPYNRSGSLLTWNGQYHILKKHFEEKPHGRKHYTINDVKYSNSGNHFLSAGMDKKVCVWSRPEGARLYSGGYNLDVYDGVPFEVMFQPGNGESNVVVIGAQDIHVYANLEPNARKHKTVLNLIPKDHPTKHNAGVIRWDNINPHILYASSEPQDNLFDGVHKSFDVTKGKARLTYNVNEAGDAMAIGQVLALATRQESANYLRIFDRFNKDCVQEVALEPFSGDVPSREVTCMAFSPDGVYLALARMDNSVHVYDSRMLSKGVMQNYQHEKPRFITKENHLCGVTHAQWVTKHSGQYALLSGGEDGCVRLWNPMWSNKEPSNGQKITEAHSDIGYFSVGDPFMNEHDLVVGDSSGEVTIYTGLLNHL